MEARPTHKEGPGGDTAGVQPAAGGAREGAASSSLWRLATRAADAGDYERIPALFAAAQQAGLSPGDAVRWQRLLLESGHFDLARSASLAAGATPTWSIEAEAVQNEGDDADDVLDFEPGNRLAPAPLVPAEIVSAFLRWFAGRADVYARQWYDARRDRSGYWPVREPLTAAVVEQHLLGRFTVGQYVLHPDNTVSFAAIDLDPTAEAIEHARLASGTEDTLPAAMLEYALRIREQAERAGIPLFLEHTGGAGLHLWMFFAPRAPAGQARGILRELLWRSGAQPPSVGVEIFPKQDQLSGKGLGNLIKLPLGIHQVTLRPSSFLDARGRPIAASEALALLRSVPQVAAEALQRSRVVPLQPCASVATQSEPLRIPATPTPRALAEALAAIPPGKDATEAADRILSGCAVLRELARRAYEGPPLPADAARALLYSVGLVGRENERIESLFAAAGISRKELERVRRGLQAPVGCKRLRERFASLGVECACPSAPPGGYATPALFALGRPPSLERRRVLPTDLELPEAEGEVSLLEVERRLARIESALARLAARDANDPPDA